MEEFKTWFVFYYQNPQPEELTNSLMFMKKNGLLDEFPEVVSMFMAQIFKSHSASVPFWTRSWANKLNEMQWTVVIVALWMADQNDLKQLAIQELSRLPQEKSQKMSKMFQSTSPKTFNPLHAEILHVGQVNMLWAAFSATGDPRYIERVVELITLFTGGSKVLQKNIGEAALVSLAQNTLLHPAVEDYVKKAEKNHPDPTTRALIEAMMTALAQLQSKDEQIPGAPSH